MSKRVIKFSTNVQAHAGMALSERGIASGHRIIKQSTTVWRRIPWKVAGDLPDPHSYDQNDNEEP